MRKTIEKGTSEWWTWIAMLEVAKQERKRLKLPPTAPITIDIKLCNRFLQSIRRNPLKKLRFFLTVGDLHPSDREKIGGEVAIKAENGVIHGFFRKG